MAKGIVYMKKMYKKVWFLFVLLLVVIFFFSLNVSCENNYFVGQVGSPTGSNLYNSTNTFEYVEYDPNEDEIDSTYVFYDTNSPNNNLVYGGTSQITVLTHGLGGKASSWSNKGSDAFAYDNGSLISRIDSELYKCTGNRANIYWAKMYSNCAFKLYDLNNASNINNSGIYQTNTSITQITDISKHIIIIFESSEAASCGYNYQIYEEFNYMLSKIVYDVKLLNGGLLPKINLIGHSRGGLTNLEYVLDHPLMIGSVFSVGTPYFGSDTAETSIAQEFQVGCDDGVSDIVNSQVYLNYYNRWNINYNDLYSNIDYYAIGGYSNSDFLFEELIEYLEGDNETAAKILRALQYAVRFDPILIETLEDVDELRDILPSLFNMFDLGEFNDDDIIEALYVILDDIQFVYDDETDWFLDRIFNIIMQTIPVIGPRYYLSDLLVDLSSQIGINEHSSTEEDYNFEVFQKCFRIRDYNNKGKKLAVNELPAVVHNLETMDDDLISYILAKIKLGISDVYICEDLTSTTTKIVGYRGEILFSSISFPTTINGKTVTEIGPNIFHFEGDSITSITIPDSIECISNDAFIGLINLEQVLINTNSSSLQIIGDRAFAYCESLTKFGNLYNSLNIPNNVESIGNQSFYGTCFNNINLNSSINTIGSFAFANIDSLYGLYVANNSTFYSNNGILYSGNSIIKYPSMKNSTTFIMPSNITNIADGAFENSTYLTFVNLGCVETIGNGAFLGCAGLTSLNIPNSVTAIGSSAFKDCASLEGVTINRSSSPITSIGADAFNDCSSNLQIVVPKNRICDYKNKLGWNRYKTQVVPDSNSFSTYNVYSNSNISFNDSISAGLNKLYRLDVINEYYYGIKSIASYNALVELYDGNMNFIDSSLGKLSKILDSNTTYYVSISFESASNSGTISTQIKHFHDYDDHYVWKSLTEHKSYCYCLDYDLDPHIVSPGAFQGGLPTARCLLCNGFASFGEIYHEGVGRYPYTLNGSFILPNGVIVLEEADMEAYLNGTLVFIDPNDNIDRNNHTEYYYREEECERIY